MMPQEEKGSKYQAGPVVSLQTWKGHQTNHGPALDKLKSKDPGTADCGPFARTINCDNKAKCIIRGTSVIL